MLSFSDFETMSFNEARGRMAADSAHSQIHDAAVSQLRQRLRTGVSVPLRQFLHRPGYELDGATYEQLLRLDEQNVKRGVTDQEWRKFVKQRTLGVAERDHVDPITQDKLSPGQVVAELHCGHLFDPPGLREWFKNNHLCPVCRADVLEPEVRTTSPRRRVNAPAAAPPRSQGRGWGRV
eukprot:Hpha_TRINITY_DN36830_c0_g1::TRINITY_DN36830_c0_g1_i1::g.139767::m.139767